MKILVTGALGFIGKNLIVELHNHGYNDILSYDVDTNSSMLDAFCKEAEFVYHLAGVNRPQNQDEFMKGNFGFTSTLLDTLKTHKNTCPIMISSSIQAKLENPYGQSKKAGEDLMFEYAKQTGAKVLVYRFPNVFGKWCRPNYNSAIATFCYNTTHDLPIQVNDPSVTMNLVYIDDVVNELIGALTGNEHKEDVFCVVPITYTVTLGRIVELIESFKESRSSLFIPKMTDTFTKKLYSTYLSYMPTDKFAYEPKMNLDARGSFTEILKTADYGQVSVNITKPGITKGNHWHHTKNEKFLVVSGTGVIRFRKIDTEEVVEYFVDGNTLRIVDIPPGYTHNIENIGTSDLVTIMWANEPFNPNFPDTFSQKV